LIPIQRAAEQLLTRFNKKRIAAAAGACAADFDPAVYVLISIHRSSRR
jgi:hypothetical protein